MLKKASNFFLAILSGLLLAASWFAPLTLLVFIGFVPLFVVTNNIHNSNFSKRGLRIWAFSYVSFFLWNILATWWVYNASLEGAIMAIGCNALLMSWAYLIWYKFERKIFGTLKFWLLIPLWLAFEYGHMLWDLTWPWLSLGNVFANTISFVQWYEITGTSGGALWIFVVNVLLVKIVISENKSAKAFLKPILILIIPIVLSGFIALIRNIEVDKKINVTIVQPNIDPYNTKFVLDFNSQLSQLHQQLSQTKNNKNTQLVVLPETFIIEDVNENDIKNSEQIATLINVIKVHFPKAAILVGASTYKIFSASEKISSTARKFDDANEYYDMYNSAIYIDTTNKCSFYHKSKLVPGVERMPFPAVFKYFEKFAIELGGTSGSLAKQEERTVFNDDVYGIKLAPSICYESVYGDFMSEYFRGGAQVLCIITNDGWWGNTPGHRQHLAYAKLRAIESRKQVIRSANTGISCFIDELGNIEQAQKYWEFAVINQDVSFNSIKTFFVRFGDIISYASVLLTLIILAYSQYLQFKNKAIN